MAAGCAAVAWYGALCAGPRPEPARTAWTVEDVVKVRDAMRRNLDWFARWVLGQKTP